MEMRQRTALNEDDKLSTTEGLSLIRDTVVEEVATQQHNIFRWIYWLATCIGAPLGMAVGIWEITNAYIGDYCTEGGAVRAWLIIRLVVGVLQFPVHAFVLMPARLSSAFANAGFMRKMFSPKGFYNALVLCNLHIAGLLAFGSYSFARLVECRSQLSAVSVSITWVLVLEAINLGLWFYVLAARLIAGISGKTRSWFWLAWGPQATGASGGRCPVVPLAAAPATNQNQ